MIGQPKLRVVVFDNDKDEISVKLDGKEIKTWSFSHSQERYWKMQMAKEFVDGWHQARKSLSREQDEAIHAAYLSVGVLHIMCRKAGLTLAAQRAKELQSELDAAFPGLAALSALRSAPDANTNPNPWFHNDKGVQPVADDVLVDVERECEGSFTRIRADQYPWNLDAYPPHRRAEEDARRLGIGFTRRHPDGSIEYLPPDQIVIHGNVINHSKTNAAEAKE